MDITVRKARADELKIIQDLCYKLFLWDLERDPMMNINWPYEPAGVEYFQKKISGETGVCFVAEVEGTVIGYMAGYVQKKIAAYDTVRRSELDNIYVEADYHSKGVGKALAKEFLKWSKENGAVRAMVNAYSTNEQAIGYYKSVGFKPREVRLEAEL